MHDAILRNVVCLIIVCERLTGIYTMYFDNFIF